jgi:hypothetical protein
MFISGPRNTGSLGDEAGMDNGYITKGLGGDHIGPSIIFESGSRFIGIGNTTPANVLHLIGNVATPSLRLGSTSLNYFWDIGRENSITGDFVFNNAEGGSISERARITVSGNVGIGFTAPSSSLAVNGNASIGSNLSPSSLPHGLDTNGRSLIIAGSGVNPNYGVLFLVNNSTEATGALLGGVLYAQVTSGKSGTNAATKAGISVFATGSGGSVGGFGGYMALYTRPDNAANDIGSYERMRIDMNGNVGIGTTSPTQGKLVVSNAGPSVIANRETSVGVNSSWNASDGSITFFGNTSNHPLVFITNNTERLQITSTGNTIITADAGNEQFIIRRASNNNAQLIIGYHSSGYGRIQAVEQGVAFRTLALNESGGAVGIGTTTPNTQLHVVGSLTVNDVIYLQRSSTSLFLPIANYWNGSGNPLAGTKGDILAIGNSGGDGLVFVNSNTERMRITSGGNVGIGATSPATRMQINDSGAGAYTILTIQNRQTRGAGVGARINLLPNSDFTAGVDTGAAISAVNSSGGTNNDTNLIFETSALGTGAERMRISSGGNVGIGATSPGVRLVNSGATLASAPTLGSGTIGANAILSANGLYGLYTGVSSEGWVWQQVQRNDADTAVYSLILNPSGGNVFVGGTSVINSPKFSVIGSGVWDGGCIGLSNTGTGGQVYTIFSTNNAFSQGGSNLLFYNATLGTNNLILYSNGNYDFMGSDVSDRRLKQDIEDLNYGLDEIMELSPKSYHLKSKNNLEGSNQTTLRKRYGFIAQEIQPVLPDAITGEETETDYLGLDYNGVLAVAVKAIQELSAKVAALEAQQ